MNRLSIPNNPHRCQQELWVVQCVIMKHGRWVAALVLAAALWGGWGAAASALSDVEGAEPRMARAAGRFYPADAETLQRTLEALLAGQPQPGPHKPRLLIVPHAGYPYSGPVAAAAFACLKGQAYDGVVVVGFTHRMSFGGVSVDPSGSYRTPLGELPVDQRAAALLRSLPGMHYMEDAHESGEHSLEVELPFLQAVLGRVPLVPVLMGSRRFEDALRLADALAQLARQGDYLFVFSSDLSHDHPYDAAQALDQRTIRAITSETPEAVSRLFAAGRLEACGQQPILTSLLLASRLGYPRWQVLASANSGDTAGDRTQVVGYAALGAFDPPETRVRVLSPEAGAALVQAARRVLDMHLRPAAYQNRLVPLGLDQVPELRQAHGLFVTLRKHGQLRGCIGRIHADQPLAEMLPGVALDAALRDPRFQPLGAEEWPQIAIEVSVLTPPVRVSDPSRIVPGQDGVILEHQGRSGVFLPQVWQETGWTREEFLRALASQKAGLPPEAWRDAALYTFQDQHFDEKY